MKILAICQYYYPEPFRVADTCEALVEQGHEVDVVTSFPNYPMGKIYDGYKNGEHKDEVVNGVNVHRVFTIGRKTGVLYRFINYFTYSIASTLYVSKLKKDYDAVFVYQLSPVMMAEAALKYKKKYGKKIILYCLDLWPDSLSIGGIKKGNFIYKFFEKLSVRIYKAADKILVSSKSFAKKISEMCSLNENEIVYLPQYAEEAFEPVEVEKKGSVNLTFAGNIGTAQNVETIIKAAVSLKSANIKFHIVGDGAEFDNIKALAKSLKADNVEFYGRRPIEEMQEIYAMSDAMLVTLADNEVLSLTLPGKVQSYMAAGKAVIGAANGETAEVIKEAKCGFCAPAEDEKGLVDCINKFLQSDVKELEKNALEYYKNNFGKESFIRTLNEEIQKQI